MPRREVRLVVARHGDRRGLADRPEVQVGAGRAVRRPRGEGQPAAILRVRDIADDADPGDDLDRRRVASGPGFRRSRAATSAARWGSAGASRPARRPGRRGCGRAGRRSVRTRSRAGCSPAQSGRVARRGRSAALRPCWAAWARRSGWTADRPPRRRCRRAPTSRWPSRGRSGADPPEAARRRWVRPMGTTAIGQGALGTWTWAAAPPGMIREPTTTASTTHARGGAERERAPAASAPLLARGPRSSRSSTPLRFAIEGRGRPGPQVPRRLRAAGRGGVRSSLRSARKAFQSRPHSAQPSRCRASQVASSGSRVTSSPSDMSVRARSWPASESWWRRRNGRVIGRLAAFWANVASRSASAACSASFSAASARRRLSRARVRIARAATWLTPIASASSRPLRSCSSARMSAARWRSGIRARARSSGPDRRRSIASRSADGAAPCDSPVHGIIRTIFRRRSSSRATRCAIWYSHARAFSSFWSVS